MSFISTYSNTNYYYGKINNINMQDVAHGLSNLCRFSGQCREFYSVAQHSVHCAEIAMNEYKDIRLAKIMLVHDATEAFVVDVPRPLKKILGVQYSTEEDIAKESVFKHVGIDYENEYADKLRIIDGRMLITEATQLFDHKCEDWTNPSPKDYPPYDLKIVPWTPYTAKRIFNQWYLKLFHSV